MEYNPLENIPCEVDIKDFWEQYYEDQKSMNAYHYLLKTITSKIKWFIIAGERGSFPVWVVEFAKLEVLSHEV